MLLAPSNEHIIHDRLPVTEGWWQIDLKYFLVPSNEQERHEIHSQKGIKYFNTILSPQGSGLILVPSNEQELHEIHSQKGIKYFNTILSPYRKRFNSGS